MAKTHKIAAIPGDGIGQEVTAAAHQLGERRLAHYCLSLISSIFLSASGT